MSKSFAALHPYYAYYLNLDKPGVITRLQYRFRGLSIVYGIQCKVNGMIYVGSSAEPGLRFDNHLISGNTSNANLQADINKYGLREFTVYVFEVISYPDGLSYSERRSYLHTIEQGRIDRFPKRKLYNSISASARTKL